MTRKLIVLAAALAIAMAAWAAFMPRASALAGTSAMHAPAAYSGRVNCTPVDVQVDPSSDPVWAQVKLKANPCNVQVRAYIIDCSTDGHCAPGSPSGWIETPGKWSRSHGGLDGIDLKGAWAELENDGGSAALCWRFYPSRTSHWFRCDPNHP